MLYQVMRFFADYEFSRNTAIDRYKVNGSIIPGCYGRRFLYFLYLMYIFAFKLYFIGKIEKARRYYMLDPTYKNF